MNTQARTDAMFASPVQVRGAGMRSRTPGAPVRVNERTTAVSPNTPLPHLRLSFFEIEESEHAANVAVMSPVQRTEESQPTEGEPHLFVKTKRRKVIYPTKASDKIAPPAGRVKVEQSQPEESVYSPPMAPASDDTLYTPDEPVYSPPMAPASDDTPYTPDEPVNSPDTP